MPPPIRDICRGCRVYIEGISKNRYLTGRIGASAASINQAATELARARPNIHPSSSSPIRCDSIGSKLSTGRSCPQSRYLPLPLPPSIVAKRRRRRCVVDDSFLAAFLPRPTDPDSNLDRSRSVSGKMWLDVGRPHRTAVSSGGNWNGEREEEGGSSSRSCIQIRWQGRKLRIGSRWKENGIKSRGRSAPVFSNDRVSTLYTARVVRFSLRTFVGLFHQRR